MRAWVAWVAVATVACAAREPPVGPCAEGLVLLEGACVTPREADVYCGGRSIAAGGAAVCAAPSCAVGEGVDTVTSSCVAEPTVREHVLHARPASIEVAIACPEPQALLAHGDRVACLAREDACPATTTWSAGACRPLAPCPPGEVRDGLACTRVRSGGRVAVSAWARAVLEGRLCAALRRGAWDLVAGDTRVVTSVTLVFPDNDVPGVTATVDVAPRLDGLQPRAQAAVEELLVPLRALGGTAEAASATVQVACDLPRLAPPRAAPPGRPAEGPGALRP
jgi:hypothetical protein